MAVTEDLLRWAAAIILASIFCVFAAYNALGVWQRHVRQSPAPSLAPIFGGLFGMGAVLSLPVGNFSERLALAWIPLLLDLSVPVTAIALWRDWTRN